MGEHIIGIDLGTTNTCTAYVSNKVPRVIATESGFNTMPSVVTFAPDGSVLVGQSAKELMVSHPERAMYGIKRLIGRQFASPIVQELKRRFRYNIVAGENGFVAVEVDGNVHTCGEIQTKLLQQVKRYAEIQLGEEIPNVVISVPAYFNDQQRSTIRQAGEDAGFDVKRIVNEPTAAALAYGFNRGFDQKVMVYDLGGGTFDVSVLEITNNVFQVVATGGDMFLGGADFDSAVIDWINQEFEKEHKFSLFEDPAAQEKVRTAAERAKIELSLLANTQVRVPAVTTRKGRTYDLDLMMSRDTLNAMTQHLVDRTFEVVDSVLQEQGIDKRTIDEIILVGGQTRMPLVIESITSYFGKAPRKGIHPDECVALGAALLGDSLASIDAVTLMDAISLPIGISLEGEDDLRMIVEPQTQIPCERILEFPTWEDDQTEATFDIFQGAESARQAEYLGTVHYDAIPKAPKGEVTIKLAVSLDAEGMLKAVASDSKSNDTRELELTMVAREPVPEERVRQHERIEGQVPTEDDSGLRGLVKKFVSKK